MNSSQSMLLPTAALTSPENLLEVKISGPNPRNSGVESQKFFKFKNNFYLRIFMHGYARSSLLCRHFLLLR